MDDQREIVMSVAGVSIPVIDIGNTVTLYRDILGFSINVESPHVIQVELTNCSISLTSKEAKRQPKVIFITRNFQLFYERIRKASVDIDGPYYRDHKRYLFFRDPAGNLLSVEEETCAGLTEVHSCP